MNSVEKVMAETSGSPTALRAKAGLLIERARWAAAVFARYDRAATLKIAEAVAIAAHSRVEQLGLATVEATGRGIITDKQSALAQASLGLFNDFNELDLVDPQVDSVARMFQVPRPAGVIVVTLPEQNPLTAMFSVSVSAMLTRNAVVFVPDHATRDLAIKTGHILAEAAVVADAPAGVIQVVDDPSALFADAVVSSEAINLVLAMQDPWSSAIRARPFAPVFAGSRGNTPVFADGSGLPKTVARDICYSKFTDQSLLSGAESVLFATDAVLDRQLRAFIDDSCHIASDAETAMLRSYLFAGGAITQDAIGRSASFIARQAGFKLPKSTKLILTEITGIGLDEPLSREKPFPVLAFRRVRNSEQGFSLARALLRFEGAGLQAAIHSNDPALVLRFAATVEAAHVVVNGPAASVVKDRTAIAPGIMLSPGYAGASPVAGMIDPRHLVHWTMVAYTDDSAPKPAAFAKLKFAFAGPLPEAPSDGVK